MTTSADRIGRVVWTVGSIVVVESLVFGLSCLPAFLFWTWALSWATPPWPLVRPLILSISLVPAYLVFATTLVLLSAASTAAFGWRTAPSRRVAAGRSRLGLAQLVALHDLDARGARAGRHLLPELAALDLVHEAQWRPHRERRLHQQPVDLRSQPAGVGRRRGDWRERSPVGSHRRRAAW